MKLYYSPGACSMSDHIVLEETGLRYETVNTAENAKNLAELERLNLMGAVPVLVLDDGTPLTQNAAIMISLAEQKPDAKLLPPPATTQRARCLEWLAFVNSDLHPAFGPLFAESPAAEADNAKSRVTELLDIADKRLSGKGPYCVGEQYTIADPYLYVVYRWASHLKLDLRRWPNLAAHAKLMGTRPAVQRVLKSEGLVQAA